ncbi:MAG: YqgE/AlgH family protein [Nitrospirae bacterium]|nr:YqgE/AlgH family protein [Nitrospirota bacterium]
MPQHTGSEGSLSKGKFLVADDAIKDPRFAESVILLVDYGPHGAFGLIVNRPTELKLSKVFTDIEGLKHRKDTFYFGGPVGVDQIFLLVSSESPPEDSISVFRDVYVSGSKSVLLHMVDTPKSRQRFRVYVGYAGWGALQLEREIARGDWHVLPADAESVFDKEASEIWPELFRRATAKWVMSGSPEWSPCCTPRGVMTARRFGIAPFLRAAVTERMRLSSGGFRGSLLI